VFSCGTPYKIELRFNRRELHRTGNADRLSGKFFWHNPRATAPPPGDATLRLCLTSEPFQYDPRTSGVRLVLAFGLNLQNVIQDIRGFYLLAAAKVLADGLCARVFRRASLLLGKWL
jgi:hypothetical protein